MRKCDYCGIDLRNKSARMLSDGTQICDTCGYLNRHLKGKEGVYRYFDTIFMAWHYTTIDPKGGK